MNELKVNELSELGVFMGTRHLLVLGCGSVALMKSVDSGETYHNVTDSEGFSIIFENDNPDLPMFNCEIQNNSGCVRYALKPASSVINCRWSAVE